jgi:Heavy metal associated domain 2
MTTERDIGDIQVVHAIPGRIRLKVAQVRKNPVLASEIQTRLATIHGIRQVEVNPLTGSILMLYEAQDAAAPDSLRTLAESLATLFPGFDLNNFAAKQPSSTNGANSAPSLAGGVASFFGALNSEVKQVTGGNADLRILLPLALFLFGVGGVLMSEKLPLPTWYDLLWFSLGTFFMLNPRLGEERQ